MTREQVITRVKHSSMYIDDRETADYIINVLEQQPCDCVSLEVYKQVTHERDIAIEQLKELGYDFGEKIRTSDVKLAVNTIAELQNKITTQREVICNLNAMNDELQEKIAKQEQVNQELWVENEDLEKKLKKIKQTINEWDSDIQASQKDLWMYLADIKEVLENE